MIPSTKLWCVVASLLLLSRTILSSDENRDEDGRQVRRRFNENEAEPQDQDEASSQSSTLDDSNQPPANSIDFTQIQSYGADGFLQNFNVLETRQIPVHEEDAPNPFQFMDGEAFSLGPASRSALGQPEFRVLLEIDTFDNEFFETIFPYLKDEYSSNELAGQYTDTSGRSFYVKFPLPPTPSNTEFSESDDEVAFPVYNHVAFGVGQVPGTPPHVPAPPRLEPSPVLTAQLRSIYAFNDEVQKRFNHSMTQILTPAVTHIDTTLINQILTVLEIDFFFTNEHLRGFEVAFDVFLRMVKRTPLKLLVPCLILAMQHDEDFIKFITLLYQVRLSSAMSTFFQKTLIKAVLILPQVSNQVRAYFYGSPNAILIFGAPMMSSIYIGSFSLDYVICALSWYRRKEHFNQLDPLLIAASNPVKDWLLNFEFLPILRNFTFMPKQAAYWLSQSAKIQFLFDSNDEFHSLVYRLFKKAHSYNNWLNKSLYFPPAQLRIFLKLAAMENDVHIINVLFSRHSLELKDPQPLSNVRPVEITHQGTHFLVKFKEAGRRISMIIPSF